MNLDHSKIIKVSIMNFILLLLFTNVYLLLGIFQRNPMDISQHVKSLRLWVNENVKDIVNIIKDNNKKREELYFTSYSNETNNNLEFEFDETYNNINRIIFLLMM